MLIGSVNDAYSQIRRVTPDLIVVYLSCNDVEGCRFLSDAGAGSRHFSSSGCDVHLWGITNDDPSEVVTPLQVDIAN